jgi:hypothetical protein
MNVAYVRRMAVALGVALVALGASAGPDEDKGVVAVAYDGKTEDVFPVLILDIDGKVQPQPLRDVYYLAPGKHTFRLGAILDSSANVQRSNAYGKDEKRVLEIEVEAGKRYLVGAKLVNRKAADWQPVVYRVEDKGAK